MTFFIIFLAAWTGYADNLIPSWDVSKELQMQNILHVVFSALDDEIMQESKASGQVDGTTALAGMHVGSSLIVANAGKTQASLKFPSFNHSAMQAFIRLRFKVILELFWVVEGMP
jgi:hypothetical protein